MFGLIISSASFFLCFCMIIYYARQKSPSTLDVAIALVWALLLLPASIIFMALSFIELISIDF